MSEEVWRPIAGYDGFYEVSNLGRVRSVTRCVVDARCTRVIKGKLINPWDNSRGYLIVALSRDGKVIKHQIHRLVGLAFIPNPLNKPQINHVDGNPRNNRVTNLEWVTNGENTQHAYDTRLNKRKQTLVTYGGKTQNLTAWAKEYGISVQTLSRRLKDGWDFERALYKGDARFK